MYKKILLMILLLPISVKAYCNNEQLSRYKLLASHIDSYYEFNEETKKFNIKIYNINNELTILNTNDNNKITLPSNNFEEINISNLNPGNNIKLAIYPNNTECSDYRVRTIYVNLPYYNNYYNDPVCTNNDNKLCLKWANTSIYTYEQFVQKVKVVKEETVVKKPEKKYENKYGFFDFLEDYYIIILLLIIVSGSYGIYKLDKKSKFDF